MSKKKGILGKDLELNSPPDDPEDEFDEDEAPTKAKMYWIHPVDATEFQQAYVFGHPAKQLDNGYWEVEVDDPANEARRDCQRKLLNARQFKSYLEVEGE